MMTELSIPTIDTLQTPCLLLDRARLTANRDRMRRRATQLELTFRPHLKTIKSVDAVSFMMGSRP